MRKTILALAPVGAVTLAAALAMPSGPANACGINSYIGSVCYTAASYCPEGMAQLSTPNQTFQVNWYPPLYSIIGNLYGGSGATTGGFPNLAGRTLAGAGTGPGLTPAVLAVSRGAPQQTLNVTQMPSHTHAAAIGIGFTGGSGPSITWQAAATGGTSPNPSAANSYVAGISPGTNMWSASLDSPVPIQGVSAAVSGGFTNVVVTNAQTGGSQAFDSRPPGVVLLACMPYDSSYPYPVRP